MNSYTSKYKKDHGIMFHHFHKKNFFPKSPGSISLNQLDKIIQFIGPKNIINAEEYLLRKQSKTVKKNHFCLTFDDGLKSQMLTLKILKKYSIKAFFFINTKFVGSKKITPELIRFFIYNHCKGIKNFYNIFENNCNLNIKKIIKDNKKKIQFYKSKYKFYTIQDIKFRIIRNSISQKKYFFIMEKIMKNEKFNYNILKYKPYMSEKDLIKINKNGHLVGLHTHSHPSDFSCLSSKDQKKELFLNIKSLKRILKNKNELFETFSYPAGNYSRQTLRILKDLNIKIAFTNSIETKTNNVLETPRINHKYLIKHIK